MLVFNNLLKDEPRGDESQVGQEKNNIHWHHDGLANQNVGVSTRVIALVGHCRNVNKIPEESSEHELHHHLLLLSPLDQVIFVEHGHDLPHLIFGLLVLEGLNVIFIGHQPNLIWVRLIHIKIL